MFALYDSRAFGWRFEGNCCPICGVIQEDHYASFSGMSATWRSAQVKTLNRQSIMTIKWHANLKKVIIYYNPTK
jgi:hypothetical protein